MRFLFLFILCFCCGVGAAYAQSNVIQNGDFSQGLSGWHVFDKDQAGNTVYTDKIGATGTRGNVSIIDVEGQPFKKALRATVSLKPGDPPYFFGIQTRVPVPLRKGKPLSVKIWMRSPDSAPTSVLVEEAFGPYASSFHKDLTLTPQWKQYDIGGASLNDYEVGQINVTFWLGHVSGTIEMADTRVLVPPHPELDLQFGHGGGVQCAAYSPDGKIVATGGKDGTVKLWSAATGQLIRTIRVRFNASSVLDVVFSPDGQTIATGCQDPGVDLWNVQTGVAQRQFGSKHGWETGIAFSPDGKLLACLELTDDLKTEMILLRDAQTGETRRTLSGSGGVTDMEFSLDGHSLVSGSWDGKVRIWDATTGELKKTMAHADQPVYGVAFSPDGQTVASASVGLSGNTLRLWNARSGESLQTFPYEKGVRNTAFSPDGKIVAGAGDGIKLWDVHSGELVRQFADDKWGIGRIDFSPDGQTLAAGGDDTTSGLWDVGTGKSQKTLGFNAVVAAIAVSPDGKTFASSHGDGNVRLWNSYGELGRAIAVPGVETLIFLADGGRLLTGSRDGTVQLWEVSSGKALQKWDEGPKAVRALALSPDGKTLASGNDGGAVKLRNASSGELLRTIEVDNQVFGLAFSPDGGQLACGTEGQQVKIVEVNSGMVSQVLTGFTWIVSSLAFSPDGKWLGTGSWDGTFRMWDLATGKQLWTNPRGGRSHPVKFSADGQSLICGAVGQLVTLDAKTGQEKRNLLSRGGDIQALCLSPDQRTIFTGGEDSIKIWDNASGRLLATIVALPPQAPLTDAKPLTAEARPLTAEARALTAEARALTAEARPLTAEAREVGSSGDYLVATPDGYYAGSATIDRYVHFKLFEDSFPAECFQSRYYRPDLVHLALSGAALPPVGEFKGAYPPLATFAASTGTTVAGNSASVTVDVSDDSTVQSMAFFVNGARVEGHETATQSRPLTAEARGLTVEAKALTVEAKALTAEARPLTVEARPLTAEARVLPTAHTTTRSFTATLPLPIDAGTVKVQAIAFDDDGLQSPRAEMTLTHTLGINNGPTKGQLLGLCVGVSHYKDARLNLKYADADANALASDFNKQKGLYSPTAVLALTNEWATAAGVTAALDALIKQTTPADTVVISLSGHGWRDDQGKFYFATTEVDRADVAHTALSWNDVVSRLTRLSEKSKRVIVLLDACHSGSAATNEEMVKAILGANAGVLVFASSRGSEVSLENADWAHGAFTKALLEAAQGLAASEGEKNVTTIDFIAYVSRRVKILTENQQHPQVPFLQDFDTDAPIVAKP